MNALQAAEKLLTQLNFTEKAQLLEWVARDLKIANAHIGIEKTPDVCGGVARIVRTRIPVWTLVQIKKLGVLENEILKAYPTLRLEDLDSAWAYYNANKEEIEAQIVENEMD